MILSNTIRPAVVVLCCAAAGIIQAKNIDHTPDFASADYWDSHHIALARITAVRSADSTVTYQVETRFSDDGITAVRTVPLSQLWFGLDAEESPQMAVDDRFIISYKREEPSRTVAIPLSANGARLLESLRVIARLRENPGDLQPYLNQALASDPTAARYSLQHLLSQQASLPVTGEYLAKLRPVRDNRSRETEDRVLAGRLVERLETGSDHSDGEYAWLESSLAMSQNQEWEALTPFVNRLLEFDQKRTATIAFLTQLASNPAVAMPVRIASYGAFTDPKLFQFEKPDAESARIYETCLQLLSDSEPAMRRAGAALLHNITMNVNEADRPGYIRTSKKALADALSSEKDELAWFHLTSFLNLLAD